MPELPSGDGSRHDTRSRLVAEYMFGLLDYETWNIWLGPRWIGQVTLNDTDNLASFTAGDDFSPLYSWMQRGGLRNWRGWLRSHAAPRGTHETAF